KLLLLTGQRVGEVVGMRRSEINGDVWVLPPAPPKRNEPARTKNGERHEVPLSAQALAIIEAMPVIDDDFVFTTSKTGRLGNMFRAKTLLDAQIKPREPWVLHDLRRTVETGMAALGIQLPVIEKVVNHKGGSFAGIVGVYQRHQFASEKRRALQTWADYVEGLVTGKTEDNVVQMQG